MGLPRLSADAVGLWFAGRRRPETLELLLSGLFCLGIGAAPIFDRAPEVHEWGLLALTSLVSGLTIGLSLMLAADRTARHRLDTRIPHP